MEKIRADLTAKKIDCSSMSDKEVRGVARALGFANVPTDPVAHNVEIVESTPEGKTTPRKYVKTGSFVINQGGKDEVSRGLYLRVEHINQAIEDLQKARELLKK